METQQHKADGTRTRRATEKGRRSKEKEVRKSEKKSKCHSSNVTENA
jgi:hypothetical protein